ncbi:unnamed protein product [Adineta ricciae]|uniref:W2 domain-containing protein n=1 Tax=Adineta ricciae TaxID=249248 RepID=A0A815RQ83_ADIRI|nr:unnamed protein product [Adineta ricciae]
MATCEEESCSNFQSVICLHCMGRLCIDHMEVHQTTLFNKIQQVKDEVNEMSTVLVNASNAITEERTKEEKKWKKWRSEKVADIEREYVERIGRIRNRQQVLVELELELNQRLKDQVQQPLEEMLSKKSVNRQLLDTIQTTLDMIKKDSDSLKWKDDQVKTRNKTKVSEQAKNEPKSSENSATTTTNTTPTTVKFKVWKPRNYLFTLFRDTGKDSHIRINQYIQTEMKNEDSMEQYGLITLVYSYLTTWHQTKAKREKHAELILKKHITTIKQYINGNECQRKVLIAMQFFDDFLKKKDSSHIDMMNMLLYFFSAHKCISSSDVIDWYQTDTFVDQILKRKVNKEWAEPFFKQNAHRTVLTEITRVSSTSSTSTLNEEENYLSVTKTRENVRICKPFKNLVKLFKDVSLANDQAIHEYVQMQYSSKVKHRVIMIVRTYLKAWNDSSSEKNTSLLLKKISAIKHYQSDKHFQIQILFAIEAFLSQSKMNDAWQIEVISILLQLFLEQDCLDKESIVKWYNNGHIYNEIYYKQTKDYARTFVERLIDLD